MKKGIILIIMLCSIIMCSKVKALSLDGTITGYYNISSSFNIGDLQKYEIMGTQGGVYNNNWSFDNYYTPSNGTNYIVFNYVKYFKHWDGSPNPSYEVYDNEINDFTITARIYFNRNGVGDNTNCEIQNNLIICPVFNNNSYRLLQIQVALPESQPAPSSYSDMYIAVDNKATLYSSATQSIIENQNNNTQQILDNNTTYTNETMQDYTNETQQEENYTQAEKQLLEDINLTQIEDINITISDSTSSYIWQIIDRLRSMSTAIVTLMTSVLGLGIIKMVLNR